MVTRTKRIIGSAKTSLAYNGLGGETQRRKWKEREEMEISTGTIQAIIIRHDMNLSQDSPWRWSRSSTSQASKMIV